MLTNWFKVVAVGQIEGGKERERELAVHSVPACFISVLASFISHPHYVAII